jgi:hypothetical protein
LALRLTKTDTKLTSPLLNKRSERLTNYAKPPREQFGPEGDAKTSENSAESWKAAAAAAQKKCPVCVSPAFLGARRD